MSAPREHFAGRAQHARRRDARHLVAGRDQAKDPAFVGGAFSDGVDGFVRRAALAVDCDAAARRDLQPAGARQLVARADAGGNHHHVRLERTAISEMHAMPCRFAIVDARGVLAGMHEHAQAFDARAQQSAAALVHLHGHEPRRKLDHVGSETQVLECLGRFEAQQTAADHDTTRGVLARLADGLEILDGAVDEHIRAFAPRNGRHEGARARRENQDVVFVLGAALRDDALAGAIDRRHGIAQMQLDAVLVEELARGEREVLHRRTGKILRQIDAVVGQPRFLRQHGDRKITGSVLGQGFEKSLPDHPVANNNNTFGHCPI